MKADLIRLQREEVAIEVARRAHRRLEIESQPLNPLPNKFLVPLLEKASLEELDSVMIDRWADLLASCSADPPSAHPRSIQILSEIGADDAQLLRRIALNRSDENPAVSMKLVGTRGTTHNPNWIRSLFEVLLRDISDKEDEVVDVTRTVTHGIVVPGVSLEGILILVSARQNQLVFVDTDDEPAATADRVSLDVLISLHLLTEHYLEISNECGKVMVSYVYLTPLAVAFLKKCDRDLARQLGC